MTDLIDRRELIKALNKVSMEHHKSHIPMVEHDFRELIDQADGIGIAKPWEPEKYGKWIDRSREGTNRRYKRYQCPKCRTVFYMSKMWKCCPVCELKMKGVRE